MDVLTAKLQQHGIQEAFTRFRAAGIEPLLVKGWAIARRYPEASLRPYCDVDLCVAPEEYHRAQQVVERWTERDCRIELHAGYAKVYDRTWAELLVRSQEVDLDGTAVRLLCDEDHLRLLCLHMLAHGAWRPLWLCDIAVAIESRPNGFDWERFRWGKNRYSE